MVPEELDDLIAQLRQKERTLLEQEEMYHRDKRYLEDRRHQLQERHHRLKQFIHQEEDKMIQLLHHYQADSQEVGQFYKLANNLLDDSEKSFRQASQTLEEDADRVKKIFQIEREQIEEEINSLRRQCYNETD